MTTHGNTLAAVLAAFGLVLCTWSATLASPAHAQDSGAITVVVSGAALERPVLM